MALGILFALFGLVVGSFLNVVILRHGARSVQGRSGCMSCGKQLLWYDMLPVFSWIYLRGRCRFCGSKISVQYPIVEALTAIFFGIIGASPFLEGILPFIASLYSCAIAALLIIIATYDARHTIIPESWVWIFNALCFLYAIFLVVFVPTTGMAWLMLLGGFAAALPLFLLWLVSRGAWMGFGDVKLALGMGWLLGALAGIEAVFFAFIIGALVSVCILLPLPAIMRALGITRLGNGGHAYTMKSEVAFGPFLIASTFIVWFAILYGFPVPFLS